MPSKFVCLSLSEWLQNFLIFFKHKQLEELADKEAKIVPLFNSEAIKKTINSVLTKNVRFRDLIWFVF